MNAGTRIVIFAYQYSVVVKGIERNLANLGYETEIISDAALDEEKMKEVISATGYDFGGMSSEPYKKGLFRW